MIQIRSSILEGIISVVSMTNVLALVMDTVSSFQWDEAERGEAERGDFFCNLL